MTATPHPEDIKASLRKRFGSVTAFERARQLPARSVKDVLRGKSRPRIAREIAAAVEIDLHVLFPDRFSPNGDTVSRRRANAHSLSGAAK